jgi:CDP-6-deoxy-D-xylo-4-hexulose-3-dehydrase
MLFAGNLIKHPCFDDMRATGRGYRTIGDLATTDKVMRDTFWVGVYPGMTDEMIDHMAKTIIDSVA